MTCLTKEKRHMLFPNHTGIIFLYSLTLGKYLGKNPENRAVWRWWEAWADALPLAHAAVCSCRP
jgi:hypothetical protein